MIARTAQGSAMHVLQRTISGQAGGFLYWDNIATPACPRLSAAQGEGAAVVARASPAAGLEPRAGR
jgi:hypothetical protein